MQKERLAMTNNEKNVIKGKVLIFAVVECLSPIHIGSGKGIISDMDVLRDTNRKPFIPATSFVGILRHAFQNNFPDDFKSDKRFNNFWGYTQDKDGCQSALCCSDLSLVDYEQEKILIRDGIHIDNKNGIVRKGGKYDYELVETGSRFKFKMEFTFRENSEDFVKKTVRAIYELLSNQQIRLGAKTNNGFGKIKLIENSTTIYSFDFNNKSDIFYWLTQNLQQKSPVKVETFNNSFDMTKKLFCINLTITLKSSLIVKSADNASTLSDATQLKSGNNWVISGSSFKGAIRARAEKIVNTLELTNGETLITKLFGNVDETSPSKDAIKGKIRIEETTMRKEDFLSELQMRTRIDRFTGGVIDGALFDSMPVFSTSNKKCISLKIEIEDYEPKEQGLILLVIKDIWSGDLAVGGEKNIGRGVFEGVNAEIVWADRKIVIESDLAQLSDPDKNELQSFIEALNRERA